MLSYYARWHLLNTWVCRIWHYVFFTTLGIKVKKTYLGRFSDRQAYIFCANHTSYLDIAVLAGIMKGTYAFVGKSELAKVPLFGWMFRKLHVPVERESKTGAARAFLLMKKALQEGKSLIIFPEGGIFTKNPPEMVPFKDGAFRLAVETKTPIIPVTLKWTWRVLPDDDTRKAYRHPIEIVVHHIVETRNLELRHLDELKQKIFAIIEASL